MKLEDKSDTPIPKLRLFTFRHLEHIMVVEVDRPCRRTIKRPDNMEQRALSSSRSPDNRNQLPPLNPQIDALQHREGLPAHRERFVQIGDGDHAGAPESKKNNGGAGIIIRSATRPLVRAWLPGARGR